MEPFPHYWPFLMGIHRCPVDSHHKGPVMGSLGVYFVVLWRKKDRWVAKRSMMESFGVSFVDIRKKKLPYKQSSCRLFETPWRSCDVTMTLLQCWRRMVTNAPFPSITEASPTLPVPPLTPPMATHSGVLWTQTTWGALASVTSVLAYRQTVRAVSNLS